MTLPNYFIFFLFKYITGRDTISALIASRGITRYGTVVPFFD